MDLIPKTGIAFPKTGALFLLLKVRLGWDYCVFDNRIMLDLILCLSSAYRHIFDFFLKSYFRK